MKRLDPCEPLLGGDSPFYKTSMRTESIRKIIDIILNELVPQVDYSEKAKLYEIVDDLDKMACGLLEPNSNSDDAFDMLACYKEKMKC